MASPIISKIGTGVTFPIQITTPKDTNGEPIMVPKVDEEGNSLYDEEGNLILVPKQGWYPVAGKPSLIQNNLTALFIYELGSRFRQEQFGSRLWEAIEEPNDQLLKHMLDLFIKSSVAKWEPRIKALDILLERQREKLRITIQFMVDSSGTVENLNLEYNSTTTEHYAY